MVDLKTIKEIDPELYDSFVKEFDRQQYNLELIASENIVSPAVMAAMGTFFTNKYAEGYPGNRYYGGCQFVDIAENIARDRLKQLFGAEHANVQPQSGAWLKSLLLLIPRRRGLQGPPSWVWMIPCLHHS